MKGNFWDFALAKIKILVIFKIFDDFFTCKIKNFGDFQVSFYSFKHTLFKKLQQKYAENEGVVH